MRTALYTTVYPAVKPYLLAWSESVAAQTDQNFDVWIAVDHIAVEDIPLPREKIFWFYANANDTPATLRQRAFEEIIQAYDAVIFVDSDDILLPNRVSVAKQYLQGYDVYGCALKLINTEGKDLALTFSTPRTDYPDLLSHHNIFGLSNTAYRTETLAKCLPFPSEVVLLDWLIVSRALQENAELFFDQTPHMLYRQYATNTAKVITPYTPSDIKKATALVVQHYKLLEEGNLQLATKERRQEVQQFSASIADSRLLAEYTKVLNTLQPVFLWWECVANEKLRGIWQT
ncbi:MAG: hypothetical protein ACRCYY_12570 [Trueperaceae bacterium]